MAPQEAGTSTLENSVAGYDPDSALLSLPLLEMHRARISDKRLFSKLIRKFDDWTTRLERKKLPSLDWEPLVDELAPLIEDHSIFLETRYDGFAPLGAVQTGEVDKDIVAIAVALVRDDLQPWDTEAPAQAMAEKLSDHFGRPFPRLLSRQWQVFAGHYVRITA